MNLSSLNIPMHYGCFLGGSYVETEVSGALTTTSAIASIYDVSLTVTDSSKFRVGQIFVYKDTTNDFWYSTKCASIVDGTHITISKRLQCGLASGVTLYSMYNNSSHYNAYGGNCVADYSGSYMASTGAKIVSRDCILKNIPSLSYTNVGSTITSYSTNSQYSPGNSTYPALRVVTNGSAQGVILPVGNISIGSKKVRITANFGVIGQTINIRIYGSSDLVAHPHVCNGDVEVLEIDFTTTIEESINIEILASDTNDLLIGTIDVFTLSGSIDNLNAGTHIVFGDSWITEALIVSRLRTRWLGSANVISSGVGGNTSQLLIDRFSADVAANSPNYVWVMCGTNDYFGGVSTTTFNSNIGSLLSSIQATGARPIFWDASVGPIVYAGKSNWELTNNSIAYTKETNYCSTCLSTSRSWYSDAKCKVEITLGHSYVAANDTNVVIPITEASVPSSFWPSVNNENGQDVVFTNSDMLLLQCEKVYFSKASKTMLVFVKIPSVSTTDDVVITMLCGGTSNVGYLTAEKTALWATINGSMSCKAVFHYNNDVVDSSGITTTGTLTDATYSTGVFGKSIKPVGSSTSGHVLGGSGYAGANPMTTLLWLKRAGNPSTVSEAVIGKDGSNWILDFSADSSRKKFRSANGTIAASNQNDTVISGNWYLASIVHNGTTIRHGVNTTDVTNQTTVGSAAFTLLNIGGINTSYKYNGYICTPRYISGAMSANQIATQYNIEVVAATNGSLSFGSVSIFNGLHKRRPIAVTDTVQDVDTWDVYIDISGAGYNKIDTYVCPFVDSTVDEFGVRTYSFSYRYTGSSSLTVGDIIRLQFVPTGYDLGAEGTFYSDSYQITKALLYGCGGGIMIGLRLGF